MPVALGNEFDQNELAERIHQINPYSPLKIGLSIAHALLAHSSWKKEEQWQSPNLHTALLSRQGKFVPANLRRPNPKVTLLHTLSPLRK
jgi:hypothetical protein